MANGLVKGSGIGDREWREDFQLVDDNGTVQFKVAKSTGAVTMAGALGGSGNLTITNTAPQIVLADSTSSAKDLEISVDGDKAQFKEDAGGAGSLLVLDLANNRVGVCTAAPSVPFDVTGAALFSSTVGVTGIASFTAQSVHTGGVRLVAPSKTSNAANDSSWMLITDANALSRKAGLHIGAKLATVADPFNGASYMEGIFGDVWLLATGSLANKELSGVEAKATVESTLTGSSLASGCYGKCSAKAAAQLPVGNGVRGLVETNGTAVIADGASFRAASSTAGGGSITASSAFACEACTWTNGLNLNGATLTNEIVFSNGTKVTVSGDTVVFTNAAGSKSSTITMS